MRIPMNYIISGLLLFIPFHSMATQLTDKESYEASYGIQQQVSNKVIEHLNDLPENAYSIIDFHSRNGYNAIQLSTKMPSSHITAFEDNPSFLPVNFSTFSNISSTDSIKEESYNNRFDILISSSSFHYLNDHDSQLQAIYRVLKPQGVAIIAFAPDYGSPRFDLVLASIKQKDEWKTGFADFNNGFDLLTPEAFIEKVNQSGLHWKQLTQFIVDHEFSSEKSFRQWIIGFLSEYHYLPETIRDEFLDQFIAAYLTVFPKTSDNKVIFYDYWMLAELYKGRL